MPFTPVNFLQGEAKGYGLPSDLIQNAIEGYKASRVPKQIRQEETQRDLANVLLGHQGTNEGIKSQYLPREYEANIGLTEQQARSAKILSDLKEKYGEKEVLAAIDNLNAQSGNYRASSENYLAQADRSRKTLPEDIALLKAQVAQKQLEEEIARLQHSFNKPLYGKLINTLNGTAQPAPQTSPYDVNNEVRPPLLGGAPVTQTAQQGELVNKINPPKQFSEPGTTIVKSGSPQYQQYDDMFLNEPLMRGALGKFFPDIGVTQKVNDKTGEKTYTTVLPSGAIMEQVVQVGKTPAELKRAELQAVTDNKTYEDTSKARLAGLETEDATKLLSNLIGKHGQTFMASTGPVGNTFKNILSGKELQEMQGAIDTLTKQNVLGTLKQITGATNVKELNFAQQANPTLADKPDRFLAKFKARAAIEEAMNKRLDIIMDNIGNKKMSTHEAIKDAIKKTDISAIKAKYDEEVALATATPQQIQRALAKRGEA